MIFKNNMHPTMHSFRFKYILNLMILYSGSQLAPCKCDGEAIEGSAEGSGFIPTDEPIAFEYDPIKAYINRIQSQNYTNSRIVANPELSDAFWGEWAEWGKCNATCGKGTRTRYRACRSGNIDDPGQSLYCRFRINFSMYLSFRLKMSHNL